MTDLATLGIVVDSRQVKTATSELQRFTKAADSAEREAGAFSHASRQMNTATGQAAQGTNRLTAGLSRVTAGITAFRVGATLAVTVATKLTGAIIKAGDAHTKLGNVLRATGLQGAALERVQDRLFQISMRTGAPLEALTSLYQRLGFAAESIGADQDEMFAIIESVSFALKAQGTDAAAAAGGITQLSQALMTGKVQADEFLSIITAMGPLGAELAKHFGLSVGELTNLVREGKFSSQQLADGLVAIRGELERLSGSALPTVEGETGKLNTAWNSLLAEIDETLGISQRAAQGIGLLTSAVISAKGQVPVLALAIDNLSRALRGLPAGPYRLDFTTDPGLFPKLRGPVHTQLPGLPGIYDPNLIGPGGGFGDPILQPGAFRPITTPAPSIIPGKYGTPALPGGGGYDTTAAQALTRAIGAWETRGMTPEQAYAATGAAGEIGRYQIMQANIGPWSREALGYSISAEAFRANPAIQDQIAQFKLTQYLERYGLEGAIRAWNTGSPTGTTTEGYVPGVLSMLESGAGFDSVTTGVEGITAATVELRDTMEETRQLATSFTQTLVDGLINGEKATDALASALKQLGSQLISSGIEQLFQGLIPSKAGIVPATSLLSGAKAPLFHYGGIVSAANGLSWEGLLSGNPQTNDEKLVIAHSGERILSRHETIWGGKNGGAIGTLLNATLNYNSPASPGAPINQAMAQQFLILLEEALPTIWRRTLQNRRV